jgi:alkylation response protein AidB-like acyl-CoA dehydrogenase
MDASIAEFRAELSRWLDAHHDQLAPRDASPGSLDEQIGQMQRVKALLFDAGWMRHGWPERVGGLGGSTMQRTELGAALAARDLVDPGLFSLIEVLAPAVIEFAAPALAADVVPRLLSGAEMWCQGFSEPGSGSDLASLGCRAVADGEHAWVINGQKVWTSLAHYSDRCVLLARTGTAESRHRGISAFFVDMHTPGITVAPIEMINGVREFAAVFFDDVVVPAERLLGEVNGGWAVAMDAASPGRRGDAGRRDVDRQDPRRDRGAGDVRRGAPRAAGPRRARRHSGRRSVAHRVPLFTRGDHLRRYRGGAAQHRRPTTARPRR